MAFDLLDVMQDADQRSFSLALFFLEQTEDAVGPILIQAGNGFIGKKHSGSGKQGADDGQTLSFSAGERGGPLIAFVGESQPLQQFQAGGFFGSGETEQSFQRAVPSEGSAKCVLDGPGTVGQLQILKNGPTRQ